MGSLRKLFSADFTEDGCCDLLSACYYGNVEVLGWWLEIPLWNNRIPIQMSDQDPSLLSSSVSFEYMFWKIEVVCS